MSYTASLLLDLSTIEAATTDFSPAHKLGEGGFGSVYKVLLLLVNAENNLNYSKFPFRFRGFIHHWRFPIQFWYREYFLMDKR